MEWYFLCFELNVTEKISIYSESSTHIGDFEKQK